MYVNIINIWKIYAINVIRIGLEGIMVIIKMKEKTVLLYCYSDKHVIGSD